MRFFAIIPALAALITAVAAAPADGCNAEMCGASGTPPTRRDFFEHPSRDVHALTNAELLRRGLPLKEPIMRRGSPVRRNKPSDLPPQTKKTYNGIIEVRNSANDNLLGYIGKNLVNGGAQFGIDSSRDNAVPVSFQTGPSGSGSQIVISLSNSNPSWPLLGLVQGRDDADSNVKPGSYQYGYLGGVSNPGTQPGAPPTSISNSYFIGSPRTAETPVWTYDHSHKVLTPVWINQDGTTPAIQTWTQSGGLYFGGDQGAFFSRYPAPVTGVTYKFVSQ